MNKKMSLLATAFVMVLPVGAAFAQEDDLAMCNTMLEQTVGVALSAEGYDTSNACNLTVSQLSQIKTLLVESGAGSEIKIKEILDAAAMEDMAG